MSIKVRYFASLKESLGKSEEICEFKTACSVAEIWRQTNPQKIIPDNILAALNMEYVGLDAEVSDGDEVAFFPPVTGG